MRQCSLADVEDWERRVLAALEERHKQRFAVAALKAKNVLEIAQISLPLADLVERLQRGLKVLGAAIVEMGES